jgi:hypothetical protein
MYDAEGKYVLYEGATRVGADQSRAEVKRCMRVA